MYKDDIQRLLEQVAKGEVSVEEACKSLGHLPFEGLGFANIDLHRPLRKGLGEAVYGEGKEYEELVAIVEAFSRNGQNVFITRLEREKALLLKERFPNGEYYPRSRVMIIKNKPFETKGKGTVLVLSAGTSDMKVAEEAFLASVFFGNETKAIYDVGVAGIHRLFAHLKELLMARVIIVVAGMEGALPSVVAGLVSSPVIAVPSSVGYGASFGGIAALLSMLNSCAQGVAVVNIDNGFGAACLASLINQL